MYLWRAVDSEGEVLDILVQSRRNKKAALKLMRKLLKKQGYAPNKVVTDKLPSYGAALRDLNMTGKHVIPTVIDQNPCAHLRMPRDMIFHGWSMRLFQAWQHSATMSS